MYKPEIGYCKALKLFHTRLSLDFHLLLDWYSWAYTCIIVSMVTLGTSYFACLFDHKNSTYCLVSPGLTNNQEFYGIALQL